MSEVSHSPAHRIHFNAARTSRRSRTRDESDGAASGVSTTPFSGLALESIGPSCTMTAQAGAQNRKLVVPQSVLSQAPNSWVQIPETPYFNPTAVRATSSALFIVVPSATAETIRPTAYRERGSLWWIRLVEDKC